MLGVVNPGIGAGRHAGCCIPGM